MTTNNFSLQSDPTINRIADRRAFMKFSGGCAALGSTSLLSQLLSLQLTGAAYAASGQTSTSGYKALVCVFLNGGIDSFNLLCPFDDAEHAYFTTLRSFAAPPKTGATPLLEIPADIANPGGRKLGIHPLMPELRTLYNQGDMAFLANVGSLIGQTTKTTYNNGTAPRPLGLFSHADLIQHWQTSVPQSRSQATGWGGRMADLLATQHNLTSKVSMNVALGSNNLFQTGNTVLPYVVGSAGATLPDGYRFFTDTPAGNRYDRIVNRVINGTTAQGLNAMYPQADTATGALYSNLLQRTMALKKRSAIDIADMFFDATTTGLVGGQPGPGNLPALAQQPFTDIANATTGATAISGNLRSFAANLNMVARVIQARNVFGQTRQIFFVQLGGWDHHDNINTQMTSMLPGLSKALSAFYNATVQLGVKNDVVTFTASDFARTLTPNPSGTDHAWGGNQLIMGGSVAGGKVYGDYPVFSAPSIAAIDIGGRGRLVPTTSVDAYNAELARWFGVSNDSSMSDILPNVRNFYGAGGSTGPLGFLPT